jgi:RNAse (barnase) inhibitor barstar
MRSLVSPLIDREQWMKEFSFQSYSVDQQDKLWDLVTRAMEMQALDALLDHLKQDEQQALIQHLAEDDLESEFEHFLQRVLPNYHTLLEGAVMRYKEQLRHDLARASKKADVKD